MAQTTIDFDAPLARQSDPETSQTAAEETSLKRRRICQSVLAAAVVIEQGHTDWTAQEVARVAVELFGGCQETYRKRAGELERAGSVQEHAIRLCAVSGKPARAFRTVT